jgi:hypothetical protein
VTTRSAGVPVGPTAREEFAAIVASDPDPFVLLGAMQVGMRNMDERIDGDADPYGPATLSTWYYDVVEAYHNLIEPREGEVA